MTEERRENWGSGGPRLRLGLRIIKGLPSAHVERLLAERERNGPFVSIASLHERTRLPRPTLKRLAEADAFQSIGLTRRQALWEVLGISDEEMPLFEEGSGFGVQGSGKAPSPLTSPGDFGELNRTVPGEGVSVFAEPRTLNPEPSPEPFLPPMPLGQEIMSDYATTTLSLKRHPVSLIRPLLAQRNITPAAQLASLDRGRWVKVAGLVLIRQRPGTAAGVVFQTLEDETGTANLILYPATYDRYRPAARHAGLLQADGYVERQGQVIHVLVKRLHDLSHLLSGYQFNSRDFH